MNNKDLQDRTWPVIDMFSTQKVVKLQGFGEDSTYISMSNPAARAALLKDKAPITADE